MQWIKPAKIFLLVAVVAIAAVPFAAEAGWCSFVPSWSGGGSSYSAGAASYGAAGYGYGYYGYPGQFDYGQAPARTYKAKKRASKAKPANQ